jgi:hypothetical protein
MVEITSAVVISLFALLSGYYINSAIADPTIATANATKYMYGIGLPIMVLLGYTFYQFILEKYPTNSSMVAIAFIMIASVFIFSSWYADISLWSLSVLSTVLTLFIVVIAMAIIFYVFSNSMKSSTGWGGVFINLLFYLPCLFLDFVQYIKKEFDLTSRPIYILLSLEAILIALYVYLPKLIMHFSKMDSVSILERTVFLDIPQTLEVSKEILMPDTLSVANSDDTVHRRNFALSMWLYVNHYTSNTIAYNKETTLFDYGAGRPKITFANTDINNTDSRDTYRVYITNADVELNERFYEFKMPGQRWNQIVFNYTPNYVDLFINGHLERTFYLKNKQPNYATPDLMKIGATDGIIGAISNIVYHKKTMTKSAIAADYNILKKQSPPTIKI